MTLSKEELERETFTEFIERKKPEFSFSDEVVEEVWQVLIHSDEEYGEHEKVNEFISAFVLLKMFWEYITNTQE